MKKSQKEDQSATDNWDARIAAATAEKEAEEKKEYGVIIKTLLCNFWVSENVIPSQYKIFTNGVLTSFNLKGVSRLELIIKEIFRKKHSDFSYVTTDISKIKKCMFALLNILEFNIDDKLAIFKKSTLQIQPFLGSMPKFQNNNITQDAHNELELEMYIYECAVLGAVGSLLSVLDENAIFQDVLSYIFKNKFRNRIFHLGKIFEKMPVQTLKILSSHLYEHCRQELSNQYNFPSLSHSIIEDERYTPSFKEVISSCLDTHSLFYEYRDSVTEELQKHKEKLLEIIKYFNEKPESHSKGHFPRETAIAIRGNAIGLHIARLSGGAMSLLKDRVWDEPASMISDKFKNIPLTEEQKKDIRKTYGEFIGNGNDFRHGRLLYSQLTHIYNVKIFIPRNNQSRKKQNYVSNDVVSNLLTRANKHTFLTKESTKSKAIEKTSKNYTKNIQLTGNSNCDNPFTQEANIFEEKISFNQIIQPKLEI